MSTALLASLFLAGWAMVCAAVAYWMSWRGPRG